MAMMEWRLTSTNVSRLRRFRQRFHAPIAFQRAATQLGYLRGALRRGADPGLHEELLRRFDQELLRVDTRTPAFRRGEAAGRARG
jgi:hypothetical protein